MRMVLTGLNRLVPMENVKLPSQAGMKTLKVRYCAICRTDAKMWQEGHRDLVFPRVPGHELVGVDENGRRFAVWPGNACGRCAYCRNGRENLCEDMQITGFHHDGGFAHRVAVPEKSLIPVPAGIADHLVCFAEPLGCVIHAFESLQPAPNERIIIYGGGTLGMLAALVADSRGAVPLVIEKNAAKIEQTAPFCQLTGIRCLKDTKESEFDLAINACPDYIAFSLCVAKLSKGGRFSFFSGLKKNENLETNLLNLAHYKENAFHGAYGLTRRDMEAGVAFIQAHGEALETLVEAVVPPEKAPELMEPVLAGRALKYILNFTGQATEISPSPTDGEPAVHVSADSQPAMADTTDPAAPALPAGLAALLDSLPRPITAVDEKLRPEVQYKIDNKTKPLGALGKLEDLALRLSLIQERLDPELHKKTLFVFAADHGIAESGVSAYPAEVTGQMVQNFLDGGAAINVLCRHHDIDLRVVDMGVKTDFDDHPLLIKKKIRRGTRNFALQPAMTPDEALAAIQAGMDVFTQAHDHTPIDIIGLGEMGIANTSSASAIISVITGISPQAATGRGTGVDDKGLEHKSETIEKALAFLAPDPKDGFDVLSKVGGFEIAGIVGALLAAAAHKSTVVLDGLISTAAGLIAYTICPAVGGYLISGHKSVETAQKAALAHMGLNPLIDFNMRLGEGTGAALAIDIADAACKIMREMASFDEAGVSKHD